MHRDLDDLLRARRILFAGMTGHIAAFACSPFVAGIVVTAAAAAGGGGALRPGSTSMTARASAAAMAADAASRVLCF